MNGLIKIRETGNFVQMYTACVIVTWNGRSTSNIYTPKQYGDYLTGICGNCNADPSDSHIDASNVNHDLSDLKKREKDRDFANTFLVGGPPR